MSPAPLPADLIINCQLRISTFITRLPRQTQRILSQLRSGYSTKLATYYFRIGQETSDLCPNCMAALFCVPCKLHCRGAFRLMGESACVRYYTLLPMTSSSDLSLVRPALSSVSVPPPFFLLPPYPTSSPALVSQSHTK